MEQQVVCNYCGTIFDKSRGKCPLCGSTTAAPAEAAPPAPRRRLTEEERRQRQRQRNAEARRSGPTQETQQRRRTDAQRQPAERPQAAPKPRPVPKKQQPRKQFSLSPRSMKIAALILLLLTVLIVFYFIGDMIGWWPGLEDRVERETSAAAAPTTDCTTLVLDPEVLIFSGVGEMRELTVSVNLSCTKTVYCSSADESIAMISQEAETNNGIELKSATFTVTSIAEGETELIIQCGKQRATCQVRCGAEYWSEATEPFSVPEDYTPVLNYAELMLTADQPTAMLQVMNLPSGASVLWRSSDPTVISVNREGVLTALADGSAVITADVGGKTAELTVYSAISYTYVEGAHTDASRTDVTVYVGDRFDFFLYDSESNHIENITYTVEDPDICTVEDGYVVALSRGTTTVTITYGDQEFSCIVRVY